MRPRLTSGAAGVDLQHSGIGPHSKPGSRRKFISACLEATTLMIVAPIRHQWTGSCFLVPAVTSEGEGADTAGSTVEA